MQKTIYVWHPKDKCNINNDRWQDFAYTKLYSFIDISTFYPLQFVFYPSKCIKKVTQNTDYINVLLNRVLYDIMNVLSS